VGIGWELTRGIFGVSHAAGQHIANSAAQGTAVRSASRGSAAVRRGLVGPWDSIPAGAANYLDYSGLATPGDLTVDPWMFPLGRYVMPKGRTWKTSGEIGITGQTANRHTVVYAPTQSGKTTSIIAPWIYHAMYFDYFVVALDLKGNGDLLGKVQQYAAAKDPLPDVMVSSFDYTNPGNSVSWNWIRDLEDESAIETAANMLVGKSESDHNLEFRLRDIGWLRGLLEFAVDTSQPWTIETIINLLNDPDRFGRLLRNVGSERSKGRLRTLIDVGALGSIDYDEYFRKVQFVLTYLEPLNTHGFNEVTKRAGVSLRDLATEPGLLVVTAPLADDRLSVTASSLFLAQFINMQMKRFNRANRPVLLVLDEAPRLKERLDLNQLLATTASSGMSVLMAIQEVTQFKEEERNAILSNCATHILLGGAGDPTTAYFGSRLGKRMASRATLNHNFGRDGRGVQTGYESHEVPVLGRMEMADPPGGDYSALIHSYDISAKPVLVDLTRQDLVSR
jgi:TraM recognition site of TraD and TraG